LPRSNTNWASKRRAEYLEDRIIQNGYVNRAALVEYFGIEKSLGSMDITAYGWRTAIRKARAGEVMPDGTEVVGYKKGGSLLWCPEEGKWAPVTGSTEERRAAWGLLPATTGGAREWFSGVVDAYVADMGPDDAPEYFGISAKEVANMPAVHVKTPERAKIWEIWK